MSRKIIYCICIGLAAINPAKRQYLDPGDLGGGVKWVSLLHDKYSIEALKLLISDSHQPSGTAPWNLEGSWVEDPVIISGDGSCSHNLTRINTASADDPGRNLNRMALDEFHNISQLAIAMLAENGFAEEIVKRAERDDDLFLIIANLLTRVRPRKLTWAFDQQFGGDWGKRHREALTRTFRHTFPPITMDGE